MAAADVDDDGIINNTQLSTSPITMTNSTIAMHPTATVSSQQHTYPTQLGHVKFLRSSLPRKNTTGSGGHSHTLRFSNNFRVKEPSRKNLIVDQYLNTTTAQPAVIVANKAVTPLTAVGETSSILTNVNNFSSINTGLVPLNPNQTVSGSSNISHGKQTVLASMTTISDSDPLSHSNLPPVFQVIYPLSPICIYTYTHIPTNILIKYYETALNTV